MPSLCQALLGEELLLPCRETLWCGDARSLEQVKSEIDGWILRDISKPGRLYHADQMGLEALRDLRISMERHPYLFTAQRPVEAAVTPGFNPQTGTLERQSATLRFFSLVEPDDLTKLWDKIGL